MSVFAYNYNLSSVKYKQKEIQGIYYKNQKIFPDENDTERTIQKDANYTFSNLHKNIQWNSIIAEEDKQFVNIEISEFVEGQAQTITIKPIAANITEEKIVTIGLQPINGPTHKIKITLQP